MFDSVPPGPERHVQAAVSHAPVIQVVSILLYPVMQDTAMERGAFRVVGLLVLGAAICVNESSRARPGGVIPSPASQRGGLPPVARALSRRAKGVDQTIARWNRAMRWLTQVAAFRRQARRVFARDSAEIS